MISRFLNRLAMVFFASILSACMIAGKEIPERDLKPEERMYVGQILVEINGKPAPKCELYINSDLMPYIRVPADGWVAYKTDRHEARFSKLACLHRLPSGSAAWHHQSLPLQFLKRADSPQELTSFGQILVKWKVNDKDTEAAAREQFIKKSNVEGQVKDSGVIQAQVTSQLDAAKNYYSQSAGSSPTRNYVWREALVEVK